MSNPRRHFTVDDADGQQWTIDLPLVMGYADKPMVIIHGRGQYYIDEKALEELAVLLLRSYGYVVIATQDIRLERSYEKSHSA